MSINTLEFVSELSMEELDRVNGGSAGFGGALLGSATGTYLGYRVGNYVAGVGGADDATRQAAARTVSIGWSITGGVLGSALQ